MQAYKEIELARRPSHAVLRPTAIQVDRELEVLSQLMDNQFQIPVIGWRFGLNAVIDLIPEFGDLRMGMNIAIYLVGGLVPFAGDLFDAWWKPNIRNINLLRRRATVSAAEAKRARSSDWIFVSVIVGGVLALLFGSIALTLLIFWYIASHMQFGV